FGRGTQFTTPTGGSLLGRVKLPPRLPHSLPDSAYLSESRDQSPRECEDRTLKLRAGPATVRRPRSAQIVYVGKSVTKRKDYNFMSISEWRMTMYRLKRSVIAFFGLFALIGAIAAVMPHTGLAQDPKGN